MYEKHFGLKQRPFSLLPDPAYLMLGEDHATALSMLQYGLTNLAGFAVITGEVGCGKTTLIRHLLNVVDAELRVGLISNAIRTEAELLRRVLYAFGVEYRSNLHTELYERLVNFLVAEYAAGHRAVLIVDEAQNLSADALEELRTLSNLNADKDQLLQLVLVGQPELRDVLRRPDLRQFAQRVAVDYHLEPLNGTETPAYISHRLRVAGADASLFSENACELIHVASGGIPRVINVLAGGQVERRRRPR